MDYVIKGGALYTDLPGGPLYSLKSEWMGTNRTICTPDGTAVLQSSVGANTAGEREYRLVTPTGETVCTARPGYAEGETELRPLCRMPRTDHAALVWNGKAYKLSMTREHACSLCDLENHPLVVITHRGVVGGWRVEDRLGLSPDVILGLFVFFRYLERENEFITV